MNRLATLAVTGSAIIFAMGCASNKGNDTGSAPIAKIQAAPGGGTASEREPVTLKAGDAAPALSIEQWLKGSPVTGFDPGKVYVVEFWATWCPPCVANIPHLNDTQAKHPEIVVIGVAGSERRPSDGQPDTRVEKLNEFMAKRGDGMNYRVGYDDDRSMPKAWMEPAGQNGIPCVFIVGGDGRIAWIGHPVAMDKYLEQAIAAAK